MKNTYINMRNVTEIETEYTSGSEVRVTIITPEDKWVKIMEKEEYLLFSEVNLLGFYKL